MSIDRMPLRATSLLTPPDRAPADHATDTLRESHATLPDSRAAVPGRSMQGRIERSEGGLSRSDTVQLRSETGRRDDSPTRADAAPFARATPLPAPTAEASDMQH
ncbi:MAG: hypothetical protein ACK46I_06825, partial [Phycisphaerae bacterium]